MGGLKAKVPSFKLFNTSRHSDLLFHIQLLITNQNGNGSIALEMAQKQFLKMNLDGPL